MKSQIKSTLGLCLILFLWDGCAGRGSAVAVEQAYTADLLKCVNDSSTLEASKACRKSVDAKWGVSHGSR
jgi:hypothetical protein